ncbi:hypothetical protein [Sphingomonas morindae]|uniref:Terminase n=1 Tax=Sphingomonas morindae TaxID=1541170 RepID=A0ABY4X3L3_9SPHN|nr:hypothetical protein [Sphingomonas morindae]USI71463.1 hypothetical protein LHA26_08920 [Sphingomonas morindae]
MAKPPRAARGPSSRKKWTRARERAFLDHLALSSNIAASERVARMPVGSAYRHRRQAPGFAAAWDQALGEGYKRLEHAMLARALSGTPVVRIARDGTETHTVEHSERLAMTLLAAHRGTVERLAAQGGAEGARARLEERLAAMAARLAGDADG